MNTGTKLVLLLLCASSVSWVPQPRLEAQQLASGLVSCFGEDVCIGQPGNTDADCAQFTVWCRVGEVCKKALTQNICLCKAQVGDP